MYIYKTWQNNDTLSLIEWSESEGCFLAGDNGQYYHDDVRNVANEYIIQNQEVRPWHLPTFVFGYSLSRLILENLKEAPDTPHVILR